MKNKTKNKTNLKSNQNIVIGLTGGMGMGKTTAAEFFISQKIPVICADSLAHQALQKSEAPYKKVVQIFGSTILLTNKEINRPLLAKQVFTNPSERKKLEVVVHPYVRKKMNELLELHKKKKEKLIVLDIPLLFESKLDHLCDVTLMIHTNQKIQMERLVKLRGFKRQDVINRRQAQMPAIKKCRLANVVIKNNGSKTELHKNLKKFLKQF